MPSVTLDPDRRYVVAGATGAVGKEFLSILLDAGVPASSVIALASSRSAGKTFAYGDATLEVGLLAPEAFEPGDFGLFSCGSGPTKTLAPAAVERGATVVDNSSAFRMTDGVPLVIPEVNPEALDPVRTKPGIVANPNCSTIIMLVPLSPVHKKYGVSRVRVATYQAASGAGQAAMDELAEQTRAVLDGGTPEPRVFKEPCAFNVFSHDSDMDPETGLNVEEQKMINETRKIWGDASVRVSPTCCRVGALRSHTEAIAFELRTPATLEGVRAAVAGGRGIEIVDDRANNRFPTALKAAGADPVFVGRIRLDPSASADAATGEADGFEMLVSGDQIRKGAALNALQIVEELQRG